jgi:hypothetical protein
VLAHQTCPISDPRWHVMAPAPFSAALQAKETA